MVKIKLVSVGGGGQNVLTDIYEAGIENVEFLVLNTYKESQHHVNFAPFILLGEKISDWEGAKKDYHLGRKYFLSSEAEVRKAILGVDVVIIIATLGGGTSSGASPELARLSKESGAFTIGLFSMPFSFEGQKVYNLAKRALRKLRRHLDAGIIISNNKILDLPDIGRLKDLDRPFCYAGKSIVDLLFSFKFTSSPSAKNPFDWFKSYFKGIFFSGYSIAAEVKEVKNAIKEVFNSPLLGGFSFSNVESLLVNLTLNPKTLPNGEIFKEIIGEFAKKIPFSIPFLCGVNYENKMKECLKITAFIGRRW